MTDEDAALAAEGVDVCYGQRRVIDELTVAIGTGQAVGLVGPNGSGKSTLLRAMARLAQPDRGRVLLDGADISSLSTTEVARRMAVLPQGPVPPDQITVAELVEQGRFPHRRGLRRATPADREAVRVALRATGTEQFADRFVDRLSGGERQRVWLALALAQETQLLLLDEPTTFLDIGHQVEVLDLVERLRDERGLTVVLVLHDLNQAARYTERILALSGGRIIADGPPAEVLTAELVEELFGVRATITTHPVTGLPICLPYAALADGGRAEPDITDEPELVSDGAAGRSDR